MTDFDFEMDAGVDFEATTDVHLNDPVTGAPWVDDKGAPVSITVISGQSEAFRRKAHEIQQRYRTKARNNAGPLKGTLTYEQERDYTAEIYASVMRGWHLTKKNGGPALDVPFNEQNARNWCKANPLFASQLSAGSDDIERFAKDYTGNFTPPGSTASTKRSAQKSS